MRLVWTTDPHLNHVPIQAWEHWLAANRQRQPDGLLISGDISESDDVVFQLSRIADALARPVHFVLGNHDFYRGAIAATRQRVIEACREHPLLFYLTDLAPIQISQAAYLVGEDGWGDATEGDYEASFVRLNDFQLIQDFCRCERTQWREILQHQGVESAERLGGKLAALPAGTRSAVVLTHVPPFREACWYEGKTTDDNWAPFFVCGEVGKVLRAAAEERPEVQFTVLCGHTHHRGVARLMENLVVHTGAAEYGTPEVEAWLESDPENVRVEPAW